ncbi:MAG TPA: SDR family NAD(P)-dependent oxidoreductase [Opitutus sp.]|nr:SDR family NAD(P)-dependent oxidoreductase [Opitutus sp.]
MSEPRPNDIAIVGLAVRVPGARNVDEFWANLRAGREAVTFFTDDELRRAGVDAARLARPNYVKANAVLPDADRFDAAFFGFTPREAELLDVQQRVFLECAWTAIEHAGYDPLAVPGAFGVFAGAGLNTYLLRQIAKNPAAVASAGGFQVMIANDKDFLATRVSYKLNLRGPSLAVQTACSTSLVAVHAAVQSLLAGECDAALAGGVSIRVPQDEGYEWQEGMILSPDGHCRPFAANAAGTIGGNGAGAVVLKRAEDALADGDTIHAIIRGSAINNDGAGKVGYTAPSVEGQETVIAEALAVAGVSADEIGYVEAHGTGTALGDPIEVAALTRAFRRSTPRRQFCALGSVKSNLGHLDAAAGVAGLIKAVLAVKHGEIPASLHFDAPNPQIDFATSPFRVAAQLQTWAPADGALRRAGVSSFGIGGTNAHVVIEQPPIRVERISTHRANKPELLVLSARTAADLARAAQNLAEFLEETSLGAATSRSPSERDREAAFPSKAAKPSELSELLRPSEGAAALRDVAFTLAAGRRAFPQRRFVVARDRAEAAARLRENVEGGFAGERPRRVAFLFPGQGTQYPGMGGDLYRSEPVFRAEVDRCAEILRAHVDFDVRALLTDASVDAARLARTEVAQPVLFTLSYALAKLWASWGVSPAAMLGHSIGEWVAACLAEVFTLEEALRLVAARGRLMAAQSPGVMLAVGLGESETRALLGSSGGDAAVDVTPRAESSPAASRQPPQSDGLEVAAINASNQTVIAGTEAAVAAFETKLAARGTAATRLQTSHAYHSAMMEPAARALMAEFRDIPRRAPQRQWISNVSGTWITPEEASDPEYWARHLRSAVRFADGLATLLAEPELALLEVGAGRTLTALAERQAARRETHPTMTSLRGAREANDAATTLRTALGRLWSAGVPVTWNGFFADAGGRRVPLPTYPFAGERHWIEAQETTLPSPPPGKRADLAAWFYLPSWKRALVPAELPAVTAGEWQVIPDAGGLADKLAARLRALGAKVHVASGKTAARWIVSLRDVGATDDGEVGFEALCGLGKSLAETALPPGARLTIVANGLQAFAREQALQPTKALLHGPARVLPNEVPGLATRVVDLVWPAENADILVDALMAEARGGAEAFVALRGRERWVQAIEPAPIAAPARTPLREGGHYLITGGLGGIGLVLAEDLFRRTRARLVLLGRSVPGAEAQRRIAALRAAGAQVTVVAADVTDEAALRRVRDQVGPVNGVIHAAGTAGGGALARRTPAERAALLAPKVKGTLALERVFAGDALDFFVLMSSLTAQLGEFGQTDYAAANAFLDAYATARQRTGVPLLSIAWDAWRDTGMAARFAATGTLAAWQEEEKARRLTNAEGAEVFQRALTANVAHLIVSTVDFNARRIAPRSPVEAGPSPSRGRQPGRRPALAVAFRAPEGAMPQRIAAVWEELLGIAGIGADDNFFELGGHSLLATQVVARLRGNGASGLTLATFFEAPTIAELARRCASTSEDEPALSPVARAGELPLSFAQQALWVLDRMEGQSAHYNEFGAQRIRGSLDVAILGRALNELVRRHETLRTRFVAHGDAVRQEIGPAFAVGLPVEALTEEALPARAAELAARPFSLAQGPLLRALLVRRGPEEHVLMVVVHHLVFDGWSSSVFFREAIAVYDALARGAAPGLPPLAVQYADFAAWQRRWLSGARRERAVTFWKEQLAGRLPVLALPTDRPRPKAQGFRGRKLAFELGAPLTQKLEARARAQGASLFMTLLAGYATLLSRTAAQDEVIVGCPTAGRDRRELEPLIGFFINPLAIRLNLAGAADFAVLLERVRTTVLAAYAHAALPFEQVVEAVHPPRDPARPAIFQAMLIFQNALPAAPTPAGLTLEPWATADGPARSDLDLYLWETPQGVQGHFIYNADLFEAPAVQRMAGRLRTILETLAHAPETRLADLRFENVTPVLPRLASRLSGSPISKVSAS